MLNMNTFIKIFNTRITYNSMKRSEVLVLVYPALSTSGRGCFCSDARFALWISECQGCNRRTRYFAHSYSRHSRRPHWPTVTVNCPQGNKVKIYIQNMFMSSYLCCTGQPPPRSNAVTHEKVSCDGRQDSHVQAVTRATFGFEKHFVK